MAEVSLLTEKSEPSLFKEERKAFEKMDGRRGGMPAASPQSEDTARDA